MLRRCAHLCKNKGFAELFFISLLHSSISFLLLYSIFVKSGIPYFGDETYYWQGNLESYYWNWKTFYYIWNEGIGISPRLFQLPFFLLLHLLSYVLGHEGGVKVYILIMSTLSGVSQYFATKIALTHKVLGIRVNPSLIPWISLLGSLIYLLNFHNKVIISLAGMASWLYSLFPVTLASLLVYLETGKFYHLILAGLFSVMGNVQPRFMILLMLSIFLYAILKLFFERTCIILGKLLARLFLLIIVLFAYNAYWILPTLVCALEKRPLIFKYYTMTASEVFIRLHSYWSLLDIILFGERYFKFYWPHSMKITPLNPIIPFIVVLPFMMKAYRRSQFVYFLGLLLITGILGGKGANPPFGSFYVLMVRNLPGASLFRSPTKAFSPYIAFTYSFLASLSLIQILRLFFIYISRKVILVNFLNCTVILLAITIFFTLIILGLMRDLSVYTWKYYSPKYLPPAYNQVNSLLRNERDYFKVLWIPIGGSVKWKERTWLSAKPCVWYYNIKLRLADQLCSESFLKYCGAKYLILHNDIMDYPFREILETFASCEYLNITKVVRNNEVCIVIFRNLLYKSPFIVSEFCEIKSFRKINPCKWELEIEVLRPSNFTLVFCEPYDPYWCAIIENETFISHSLTKGIANVFYIHLRNGGLFKVIIYHKLQLWRDWGAIISLTSLLFSLILKYTRTRAEV